MKGTVPLDPAGSFRRGRVLGQELLAESRGQHAQDLHRVIRIMLLRRLGAHDGQAIPGPCHLAGPRSHAPRLC